DTLSCACGYRAPNESGVYNLLPAALRAELYPGDRADVIDFSLPSHTARLGDGWYELEGDYGNKYRWIGSPGARGAPRASAAPTPRRSGCAFAALPTRRISPKADRWWKSGPTACAWHSTR